MTQESKGPTYTDHNGFLMPKGFPIEGFKSGLKYSAGADDLFIATYPKCEFFLLTDTTCKPFLMPKQMHLYSHDTF
jgi:hypothetical protein